MSPRPHAIVHCGLAGLRRVLSSVNTTGPPHGCRGCRPPPRPWLLVCLLQTPSQNPWAVMGVLSVPLRCTCRQESWGLGKSPDIQVLLAVLGRAQDGELPHVEWGRDSSAPSLGFSLALEMWLYLFPAITALFGGTRWTLTWGPASLPPLQPPAVWEVQGN